MIEEPQANGIAVDELNYLGQMGLPWVNMYEKLEE